MRVSLQELTFNQVEQGEVKNSVSEPSIPTPIQQLLGTKQSLRTWIIFLGLGQCKQRGLSAMPLWLSMAFTGRLLCIHFHRNIWIFGKQLNFHIHFPSKGLSLVSSSKARLQVDFESKRPLDLPSQLRISSQTEAFLRGIAFNFINISFGITKDIGGITHCPSTMASLTKRLLFQEG